VHNADTALEACFHRSAAESALAKSQETEDPVISGYQVFDKGMLSAVLRRTHFASSCPFSLRPVLKLTSKEKFPGTPEAGLTVSYTSHTPIFSSTRTPGMEKVVRTNLPQTTIYSQPLQQFHAANICDIHLRPFGRGQIPLYQHAFNAISRKLERRNETCRAGANDQDASLVFFCTLCTLVWLRTGAGLTIAAGVMMFYVNSGSIKSTR
jgi:hypothetical protein